MKIKNSCKQILILMILTSFFVQMIWIDVSLSDTNEDNSSVSSYPSWPTTWTWLDFDVNEGGTIDTLDVNSTYFNISENYLYLRMNCYSKQNFSQYPDKRYKWFIDLDNNIYLSGNSIIDGEYLIFLEDTDDDGSGDIYLLFDSDHSNDFGEYEPNNYGSYKITDQSISDYRIINYSIDIYVNLNNLSNPYSMWCAWATDNENPNLDQAQIDSTDSDDLPLGPLRNIAPILVTKTDSEDPAIAGTNFTYSIWINNTQNLKLENVNLTEILDDNLTLINSSISPTINNNIWHFNLSSYESWQINLLVHVPSNITQGGELISTSNVTYNQNYSIETSEMTDVSTISNISIELIDDPDPVVAGNNLKYNITISNSGPSDLHNFTVFNILPDNISLVSANITPDVVNSSTLTWYFDELVFGDSLDITLDVEIPASMGKNILLSQVKVVSNNSVISNTSEQTEVEVKKSSSKSKIPTDISLSIKKQADHEIIEPGGMLNYKIVVINDGKDDATNLQIKDDYDEDLLTLVEISSGGIAENGEIIWDKINVNGNSQQAFHIKTQVKNNISQETLIINKAMVENLVTTTLTYVEIPISQQFNIQLNTSTKNIEYGQTLRYSMAITNLFENSKEIDLYFQYNNQSLEIVNISKKGLITNNSIRWTNLSISGKSTVEIYVDVRLKHINQTDDILWSSMEFNGYKKSISVNSVKNQLIYPINQYNNNSVEYTNSQTNNSLDKKLYQSLSFLFPTLPILFLIFLLLFSPPHIVVDCIDIKDIRDYKKKIYIATGEKVQKDLPIKIKIITPNRQIYKYLHEMKNIRLSSAKAIAIYLEFGGKLILHDNKAYVFAKKQGWNVILSHSVPQKVINENDNYKL